MRRFKMTVKGSQEELQWLNQLASKGWLLRSVNGGWYQFERTSEQYRLFSEYLTPDVASDVPAQQGPFKVLATTQLKHPDVRVMYSGTTDAKLMATRVEADDAPLQLKIALALRTHLLNIMNASLIIWVVIMTGLLYLDVFSDIVMEWILLLALITSFTPAVMAAKVHKVSNALRVRTQNYDGAWRPTEHVFFKNMHSDLDIDKVKDLGYWTLVGTDHKGTYWYDVQSLASLAEIKQTLQPVVGNSVEISIMSNLGLAPIGYL